MSTKKGVIGVLTGGGDVPGLNPAIRSVTIRARRAGYEVIGMRRGWLGGTVEVDWPILVNLRLDPFERTGFTGSVEYFEWFKFQFWRFVYVQQEVAKLAQTALEFPPMQKGASFNLDAVKAKIAAAQAAIAK
jgi:arylsulfatase